jgi:hypothetical protein
MQVWRVGQSGGSELSAAFIRIPLGAPRYLIRRPAQQRPGDKLNWTLLPGSSKVFQKLGAAELRNRHQHDAEGGKAFQRARGRLAEEAIARKDALESHVLRHVDIKQPHSGRLESPTRLA